jgi:hypothetical protein
MLEDKFIEINGRLYDEYGQLVKDESGAISGTIKPNSLFTGIIGPTPKKAHSVAMHSKRHVQKSKTLLRKAVKKPVLSNNDSAISSKSIALSSLTKEKNEDKILRVRSISKSPLIKKFSNEKSIANAHSGVVTDFVRPIHHSANTLSHAKPVKKYNPFDDAVERAIVPKHVKAQAKSFSYISTTTLFGILFILIGSLILFIQMPKLNAQVMAYKASVNLTLPQNIPAGYKLDTAVDYFKGSVTLNYFNGSKSFRVIEQTNNITANKGIANITDMLKSATPVYSLTKNNVDYFLVTDNNLTQYDINNIFSSI